MIHQTSTIDFYKTLFAENIEHQNGQKTNAFLYFRLRQYADFLTLICGGIYTALYSLYEFYKLSVWYSRWQLLHFVSRKLFRRNSKHNII